MVNLSCLFELGFSVFRRGRDRLVGRVCSGREVALASWQSLCRRLVVKRSGVDSNAILLAIAKPIGVMPIFGRRFSQTTVIQEVDSCSTPRR